MTARAIGEIVAGIKPAKERRTHQPVWRNSYTEGQLEKRLWRPIGNGTIRGAKRRAGAIMKCARELERTTRRARQKDNPGARNGVLGDIGIAVLDYLYRIVDFAKGTLEPAIATIADQTGYCYSAVHDALRRLRRAGFLHWIRRSRPTDNQGEAGPQVEQITNAYVLLLPPEFEAIVARLTDDGPAPKCEHREANERAFREMLATLTNVEFVEAMWHGDQLAGPAFKSLAAALDARDRQRRESGRAVETGGSF